MTEALTSPALSTADAFTREIVRNKLLAIAEEMGIVLARTSMSPIVYEVLDFACGLADAKGRVIAQDNGLCLFTGTFRPQVESILDKYPVSSMRPGDVYMTNSPYGGGTHNADIALILPIFIEDQLLAFGIFRHALDGGRGQGPRIACAGFHRDLPGGSAVSPTPALPRGGAQRGPG